jgi:hypothetical protein
MNEAMSPADARSLRLLKTMVGAAVATTLVAAVAGILLWILDPESGSTTEAVLGLTAAVAGLATGALAIAVAIYAQVKNLWRFAPMWVRVAVMLIVVVVIVVTIGNWRSGNA